MLRSTLLCRWLLTLAVLALLGCSAGDPAAPTSEATQAPTTASVVLAWDATVSHAGVKLDTPRFAEAIGDNFSVNAGYFFTVSPDAEALRIEALAFEPAGVRVTWGIRHPFKSVAQGAARADLDVFDLALAVQPKNRTPSQLGTAEPVYDRVLRDPTGYTGLLRAAIGDDAVLPYALLENTADYNRFAQGTDYQPLDMVFPLVEGESIAIRVYLLCQYGVSATRPTRLTPEYYNPEYNLKSAWRVDVSDPAPLIESTTGTLDLDVSVFDWNDARTGAAVDATYPNPANPTGLRSASDVTSLTLYAPDLNPTPTVVTTPSGGTGAPGDPLRFDIDLATPSAPVPGTYLALLKVADSRVPNTNSSPASDTIDVSLTGVTSFVDALEHATWQTVTYEVLPLGGSQPPVAIIVTTPDPPNVFTNQPVTFDGSSSFDPDGDIETWEWDFDYQAGSPAFVDLGPTPPAQSWPAPGTRTIALRVTDDDDGGTDIATVDVIVTTPPPVTSAHKAAWLESFSSGYYGDADGTDKIVIPSGRYHKISADGTTVVYSAGAGIGGSMYIWRQSTGSQLLRAQADDPQGHGYRADEADLSYNGGVVVYTDARAGANPPKNAWKQNGDGSGIVRLNPVLDDGTYEGTHVSYDGSKIALVNRAGGTVYSVNPDGSAWTPCGTSTTSPGISGDGQRVYGRSNTGQLVRRNADGTNPTTLFPCGDFFAIAADESRVVYVQSWDVYVRRLDGSDSPTLLYDNAAGANAWYCSIAADGRWIGWGGISGPLCGTHDINTGTSYTNLNGAFPLGATYGVNVGSWGEF